MIKKNKIVYLLCLIFPLWGIEGIAQKSVTDPGLNGQFKRMVLTQWNDWQPSPKTDLGFIPKDLTGFLFWRILNNGYYKGSDERPYNADPATGQFEQNLAALELDNEQAQVMKDSLKQVALQQAANMVNMLGGDADVAWLLYFGNKFNELWNNYQAPFNNLKQSNPAAWSDMQSDGGYQWYQNQLQALQDRANSIHQATMEKGARIVAYFNIIKDAESLSSGAANYCSNYLQHWKAQDLKNKVKTATPTFTNNSQAVINSVMANLKL